jgi:hypothetical protein
LNSQILLELNNSKTIQFNAAIARLFSACLPHITFHSLTQSNTELLYQKTHDWLTFSSSSPTSYTLLLQFNALQLFEVFWRLWQRDDGKHEDLLTQWKTFYPKGLSAIINLFSSSKISFSFSFFYFY